MFIFEFFFHPTFDIRLNVQFVSSWPFAKQLETFICIINHNYLNRKTVKQTITTIYTE